MKQKKMSYKKKFIIVSILVFIAFSFWYIKIYRSEGRVSKLIFPEGSGKYEHLIFGMPQGLDLDILEYTGFYSGYNSKVKNPVWVAYYLKKQYLQAKKILKRRKFKKDPNLSSSLSAGLNDYKKSGYDRGHLARQADMYGRNKKCEEEACYLTNIVPQKPNFNRKVWLNLENAVQKWTMKAGELWIISGPVFDSFHTYLHDKERGVEIPDGFYKILVRKNKSAGYDFLSFLMNQESTSLDLVDYIVSIDSVEQVTNLDFFHLLEDNTEDYLEKEKFKLWKNWR